MSIDDDFDCDELIWRLVGLLPPPDRIAFRRAFEEAIARAPCWREAAVYRAVAPYSASSSLPQPRVAEQLEVTAYLWLFEFCLYLKLYRPLKVPS